jgi:hypothetical protein
MPKFEIVMVCDLALVPSVNPNLIASIAGVYNWKQCVTCGVAVV